MDFLNDDVPVNTEEMNRILYSIHDGPLDDLAFNDTSSNDSGFPSPSNSDKESESSERRSSDPGSFLSDWFNNDFQSNQSYETTAVSEEPVFPQFETYSYASPTSSEYSPNASSQGYSPCRQETPEHWNESQPVYVTAIPVRQATLKPKPIMVRPLEPRRIVLSAAPVATPILKIRAQPVPQVDPLYEETRRRDEERKIRNRQFAQASRAKKKQMMEILKERLGELETENTHLKNENDFLRKENFELKERLGLIVPSRPGVKRVKVAATTIFVFGLCCTMGFLPTQQNQQPLLEANLTPSRTLRDTPMVDELNNTMRCFNSSFMENITDYKTLNLMLDSWVKRHSLGDGGLVRWGTAHRVHVNETGGAPRTKSGEQKRESARLKAIRDRAWRHLDLLQPDSTADKLPKKKPSTFPKLDGGSKLKVPSNVDLDSLYAKLAHSLQQRGDTLYLLPVQDYLLVPPAGRDMSSHPKMSLVLPALSPNTTVEDKMVNMLRVDCAVVATGLFNIPREEVPYLH